MKGVHRVSREWRQQAEAYRHMMYTAYPGSLAFARRRRRYCLFMGCASMVQLFILFLLVREGVSPELLWTGAVSALLQCLIYFIVAHGTWKAALALWAVAGQSAWQGYAAFGTFGDGLSAFPWERELLSFGLVFAIAYITAAALGAAWLTLSDRSRRYASIVRGIHIAYLKYIRDRLGIADGESDVDGAAPPGKEAARVPRLLFLPFAGMFAGLVLDYLAISPALLDFLTSGARTPEDLLMGYLWWYALIMYAVGLSILLVAAGIIVFVKKGGIHIPMAKRMMAVCFGITVFVGGAMVATEDVPGLYARAGEDLTRIEEGKLPEVTVWLSPKTRRARLPGPYSGGQPEPVTQYGGISRDTGGKWVHFYVPDYMNFSLDQEALYRESRSIQWNEVHARKYRIRYTEHLRLVVSAEPLDNVTAAQ